MISSARPNFYNVKTTKRQLSHAYSGKFISLDKESSKNLSKVALQIIHQDTQGLQCKIDETFLK
jgi:hypothetical protein